MTKRCKTLSCSNLRNQDEDYSLIPLNLIIKILLRLPAKSTARFRCVSKLWDSTIRSESFIESFFPISSSRPKLLFTCLKDDKANFYSSPRPPLAVITTSHSSSHARFPISFPYRFSRPVGGLLCCINQQKFKGGRRVSVPLVFNPSTGQSFNLPRVKTRRKKVFSYLGYDPIDKQFKVLCMSKSLTRGPYLSQEHQVLTLEFGKKGMSWRMIECDIPHSPDIFVCGLHDGICINGVLYYLANVFCKDSRFYGIVCFDVRSETFKSIRLDHDQGMPRNFISPSTLVNYKGKLALLDAKHFSRLGFKNIQLWVLEDAEKDEWLSNVYVLPGVQAAWRNIGKEAELRFVGIADTGEIVLSPQFMWHNFFLVYLNTEKATIKRVEIPGMDCDPENVYTSIDHVENLKFKETSV